ncbi:MAG: CrcB-like protein [Idiomarinaceae bacterium HL-53]|nr:MAG: CrcB-like protein [Idiomarinaceae bacterium HL-53]CUS49047.1 Fluoride ion exporter CrcB/FEX, affects chromosome condensation [Idiomarinaceae bacterium HL-53]
MNSAYSRVIKITLLLGLAGFVGSLIRTLLVTFGTGLLPAAILSANVLGSAYAAFWIAHAEQKESASHLEWMHVLGLAGGLTTFAGVIEVLARYLEIEDYFTAFVWIGTTLLLSGAAFFVTIRIVKIRN